MPLEGPILLIDPDTGTIMANLPDLAGVLRSAGAVFVGTWPRATNIANTAVQWSGRRWSMVKWPLAGSRAARLNLLAHESFQRLQPRLRLSFPEPANPWLDEARDRLWLLLELAAPRQALAAPGRAHVRAALAFRQQRWSDCPAAPRNENLLAMNEGLAEIHWLGSQRPAALPGRRAPRFERSHL